MADSQLKFHLLREVINEIGKKYCNEALFRNLLVAGKESAAALRWIVANRVDINSKKDTYQLWIKWGRWLIDIKSAYLRNFAIRNAQFLKIDEGKRLVKVASACLRLFELDCSASNFAALLNTNIDLSNLYKATLRVKYLNQCSSSLSVLTTYPERCPNLDTIVISSSCSIENIIKCLFDYCVPSVMYLTLDLKANCCTAIDFSQLSSILKCFPNTKEVTLKINANCKHSSNDIDLKVYDQLCESFKVCDFPFDFKFEYSQYNEYNEYHKDLENLFASKGKMIWHSTGMDSNCYEINIAYPKKTMVVRVAEVLRHSLLH